MLWNLRGYGRAFDLLDDAVRAELAERLGEAETSVLILDCLNPALVALGLSESSNDDTGKFLAAFDELLVEAGIDDALIVHHMGHSAERARGASKLQGWPEVNWKYVRERADDESEVESGARFLSAYGRDVDAGESALAYDAATRRLTFLGGTRRQYGIEQHVETVADVVRKSTESEGAYTINMTTLKDRLGQQIGVSRNETLVSIVNAAVERDLVHSRKVGTSKRFGVGPEPTGEDGGDAA
ncbi:hypothetical protein GCM10025762_36900 [Haloechinothrix salitolerans]